jgi:pimeloyl-ACP methyl ester carboxylesterase
VMAGFSEFSFNMIYLRMLGFQFLETEGMNYWIKEGSSSLPPLLIFHGISSGWSMYSLLIQQFSTDRTVILADLDAIKILSMYFYMPSIEQYNASILRILRRHRIDRVSVIGHSFGSITANWLISKCPQVVSHLTLIDPVAILVCMPQCVNNFIYRSLHQCRSIFECIIWFFAAREITISYALHRNFIWHSNCMWLQEIPKHIGVVVALAANDEISDAALQLAFVKSCDAERKKTTTATSAGRQEHCADITAVVWKGFSHGQILYSPKEMDEFRAIVNASEKVHL